MMMIDGTQYHSRKKKEKVTKPASQPVGRPVCVVVVICVCVCNLVDRLTVESNFFFRCC